ncbi:hypothetical protein GCM10009866_13100 [Cellulomonas aerilata]
MRASTPTHATDTRRRPTRIASPSPVLVTGRPVPSTVLPSGAHAPRRTVAYLAPKSTSCVATVPAVRPGADWYVQ